jgi:predicted phage tail protein
MTKVYVNGILGKIFGQFFEFKINNGFNALKAIDANREGFFKKIKDLSLNGISYQLIIDDELVCDKNSLIEKRDIKTIYIIPIVVGFGQAIAAAIPALVSTTAASGLTIMGQVVAFAINTAISIGIQLGVAALTASTNNQGATPQPQVGIGGASALIEARGKSFVFASVDNVASQGDPIPVGYGKVKCGSKVIHGSTKSYPTSMTNVVEFSSVNLNNSLFNEYIS